MMEQIKQQFGKQALGWRLTRAILGMLTCAGAQVSAKNWDLPGWDVAAGAWKATGPLAEEWIVFSIPLLIAFFVGLITGESNGKKGRK